MAEAKDVEKTEEKKPSRKEKRKKSKGEAQGEFVAKKRGRSKRFSRLREGDRKVTMSIDEAVKMVKANATAKFKETIELAMKLAIDTKQADQLVRGSVSLPHGIGKFLRVVAFAEGEMAEQAKAAGAVEVGTTELADKIAAGWFEFDVIIAHPSMMRHISKLGKVLGPKGLMPSPKNGTVADKVVDAVREFVAGKVEFRNDKDGNIHMVVGKADFPEEKLVDNIAAAIAHIQSLRPAAVKGDYMTGAFLTSTMGPSVRLIVTVS